jgi:nuclear-control-of-ATPase protein 2
MRLKQLREKNACAVGLLMEESLLVEVDEDDVNKPNVNLEDWQDIILRSTLLIQTVLQTVNDVDADLPEFEEAVFAHVSRSAEEVGRSFIGEQRPEDPTEHPTWVIRNLIQTLEQHLPSQRTLFKASSHQYGRPSRLVRYWLPATLLLFSSSTILNILTSRRAELITWVRELGVTVRDFWRNWVIDPLARLIGTIRHDERSEVALMTKQTLQEDRDSLERMVVDFAIDRPIDGRQYSPSEIEMIRSRVKEGDVTPVLRAYERDLRRPFVGTVRGDLVRALLIQVQKTKVDVEVSIAGIDSMLKSQQLVFGVVALTPGILVSYATLRWIAGFFGSRRGIRMGRRRGEMLRALR